LVLLAALGACDVRPGDGPAKPAPQDPYVAARAAMVEVIARRDVKDHRVLDAMRRVPRHRFVPAAIEARAYEDRALAIGHRQTISQPYIVAVMAEVAQIGPGARVLEIGTGSGYGAAVLAELATDVFTIEILEPLAERAKATLAELGYRNVRVRAGDGYAGWPSEAPFDAIVVTAAPPRVPEPLKEQLKVGGRLVIPVGTYDQSLRVITRTADGFTEQAVTRVRFVPMTGEAQSEDR
jgi:protein-L-isoaspartate(D-aspartate) O-methyltransferase